MIEYSDL